VAKQTPKPFTRVSKPGQQAEFQMERSREHAAAQQEVISAQKQNHVFRGFSPII
jgi:hypothetical protein